MKISFAWALVIVLLFHPGASQAQTSAAPAGLEDIWPEGAYGAALREFLDAPVPQQDMTSLRAVFAASPGYNGMSEIGDKAKNDFASQMMGSEPEKWTHDDYVRAIFADFPMLETHLAAFEYFKTSDLPNSEEMMEFHARYYRAVRDAILATETGSDGERVFKVLSISEEYTLMADQGFSHQGQALQFIDEVPHDVFATPTGTMRFDISAFFGKY